jgi:hypothetical protein
MQQMHVGREDFRVGKWRACCGERSKVVVQQCVYFCKRSSKQNKPSPTVHVTHVEYVDAQMYDDIPRQGRLVVGLLVPHRGFLAHRLRRESVTKRVPAGLGRFLQQESDDVLLLLRQKMRPLSHALHERRTTGWRSTLPMNDPP